MMSLSWITWILPIVAIAGSLVSGFRAPGGSGARVSGFSAAAAIAGLMLVTWDPENNGWHRLAEIAGMILLVIGTIGMARSAKLLDRERRIDIHGPK